MTRLVFCDVETTGLDPDRHEIWEVAAIIRDGHGSEDEYVWYLPVDLGRADPMALKISGFHDRHPLSGYDPRERAHANTKHPARFAAEFARLTRGAHLVGAVVSFDEERLRRLLRENGECPMWHYHLIDVEAMAVGYLRGRHAADADDIWTEDEDQAGGFFFDATSLPWRSDDLSRACGVEPPGEDERHTALGDARWVKRWYDTICGEPQ